MLRLQALGGTALYPLLVVVPMSLPNASWGVFTAVLLICVCFNAFGYLMNDLADIDSDRLDPARRSHPLVSGQITPAQFQVLVWLQLPVMAALHQWAQLSVISGYWLAFSLMCLVVYNRFSKSCPCPLLMDGLIGLSVIGLVLFGYSAVLPASQGHSAVTEYAIGLYAAAAGVCLMLLNAFPNSLRDLPYEMNTDCITTAKFLGARLDRQQSPRMGSTMAVYGACLQLLFAILSVQLCLALGISQAATILVATLNVVNGLLFAGLVFARGYLWQRLGGIHALTLPVPLMPVWFEYAEFQFSLAIALVYFATPLILLGNRHAWRLGQVDAFLQHDKLQHDKS